MDEYIEIALTEASTATDTKRGSDTVGFVYIIAKNNILDELKRLKKFKKLESNAGAPTAKELMVDSPELTILGDIAEQEMLATLTQKQRTVALLREDGYSIDEIAEKEQISYDAVNERLKAIRRKFKKYL